MRPADRPPPKKVLLRDLKVGTGPVARIGARVAFYYYSVNYKTGKRTYYRWSPEPVSVNELTRIPWQEALVGMRPGGLREVIVPSHLQFHVGTIDYIFELLRVNGRS
jgi:FKBP-type peptidyl-prolyl cis-trans isomerase